MKKISLISVLALAFSFLLTIPAAQAQTTTSGTVPIFYSQPVNGVPVNSGNTTALPAGTYYLQSGQPIYYEGNGTYYDSSTQTYRGSTNDPFGTAGTYAVTTLPAVVPTVPGTGLGGEASLNWLLLALSGIALVGSVGYASARSVRA